MTKELLVCSCIIFDPVENVKHKDRFLPEHHQIHQDFMLSSGNNWVFFLPLDVDESFRDGISVKKGKSMIDITYRRNSILMIGGDVIHKSSDRKFGKDFASYNKNCTQRRLLHLSVAPVSTLFLLEMQKMSVSENFFDKVVFVIKLDTLNCLTIRNLSRKEIEEALSWSGVVKF